MFLDADEEVPQREPRADEGGQRGTTPLAVVFESPDLVDDQLYPQLRKSLSGVREELDRRGFEPIRATSFADDRGVLFVELAHRTLPSIERHDGPPVHVRAHAEGFYDAYAEKSTDALGGDNSPPDTYGPFVDGERYVVEREREFTDAAELLRSAELFSVGLGARIETALSTDYDVLVGSEVATLCEEFGTELASYFDPRP